MSAGVALDLDIEPVLMCFTLLLAWLFAAFARPHTVHWHGSLYMPSKLTNRPRYHTLFTLLGSATDFVFCPHTTRPTPRAPPHQQKLAQEAKGKVLRLGRTIMPGCSEEEVLDVRD